LNSLLFMSFLKPFLIPFQALDTPFLMALKPFDMALPTFLNGLVTALNAFDKNPYSTSTSTPSTKMVPLSFSLMSSANYESEIDSPVVRRAKISPSSPAASEVFKRASSACPVSSKRICAALSGSDASSSRLM